MLHGTRQCNRAAKVALQLEHTKLWDAEIHAERIRKTKAVLTLPPNSVSSSYIPPSQHVGSEASVAIEQSSSFAPPSLPSIDSQLLTLPSRPNAPIASASKVAPLEGQSATNNKGKQKAQLQDVFQEFMFPTG